MRYTNANVSEWFRDEFIDLFTAVLKERGPTHKGALVAAVMERRGLKPSGNNLLMRAHADELERRGVLISQRSLPRRSGSPVVICLPDAATDSVLESLSENSPGIPYDADIHESAPVLGTRFADLLSDFVMRMRDMTESVVVQNEAISLLMDDVSTLRRALDISTQAITDRFTVLHDLVGNWQAEILGELSEIRKAVFSEDSGRGGDATVLAALNDLRQKITDPDTIVSRLASSHTMLRELIDGRNHIGDSDV